MLISLEEARRRVAGLRALADPCRLCPRLCGARRLAGETGFCRAGARLRVASWAAHRGEEPPISGTRGSGTIFASHCTLRCLFCQNFPFSQLGTGQEMAVPDLAGHMLQLARRGVHNINLVTPTPQAPFLLEAFLEAREQGLDLPLVYNTSGYESLEVLTLLDGLVDIYLPDLKYADDEAAAAISGVADYVAHDRAAIVEMFRQVGPLQLDAAGLATRGLIVRHLVLPGGRQGTRASFEWLRSALGTEVQVSLMCQYFPAWRAPQTPGFDRRLTDDEYLEAIETVDGLGFTNVWAQDPTEVGGA
ncbi:MAG: radical SAM protein [Candidatus Riflebacteria bacterium]|nr:radical SAM protein [Candidatus Riflebacteria bacterium]